MAEITGLCESGRGNARPSVSGTYWTAYNGVTEWLSYQRGRTPENRLNSLWFGEGANLNRQALEVAPGRPIKADRLDPGETCSMALVASGTRSSPLGGGSARGPPSPSQVRARCRARQRRRALTHRARLQRFVFIPVAARPANQSWSGTVTHGSRRGPSGCLGAYSCSPELAV